MKESFPVEHEITRLRELVSRGERIISISGLSSISAKAFVIAELQKSSKKSFAIVADSNNDSEFWESNLDFFGDSAPKGSANNSESNPRPRKIISLPSFETDVYSGISPHAETLERRALSLWQLSHRSCEFALISAKSLITKTVLPSEIKALGANLKRGEEFPPEKLIEKLLSSGYVNDEPIANVGEFSVRGGILDVWSPDSLRPVRIEFFGDAIESLREFDPETQRSIRQLEESSIAPMREYAATAKDFKDWSFFAREKFPQAQFKRNLKDRTDFADEGEEFPGWEFLFALSAPRRASIFDYLKDHIFVIDEPAFVEQTLTDYYEHLNLRFNETLNADDLALAPSELFLSTEILREQFLSRSRIELRALGISAARTDDEFALGDLESASKAVDRSAPSRPLFLFPVAEKRVELDIQSRSTRKFHGDIAGLVQSLRSNLETRFVFETTGIAERFKELLREYDVTLPADNVLVGSLSNGFEIPALGILFQTESDVFGETSDRQASAPKTATSARKSKLGAFISDFRDLKIGDYVVHVDHGIGRFEGLEMIVAEGASREFMLLTYAEGAKLFVPVERLDLVSRYSSGDATSPALDRLGGLGWQKTKAKAKRAMRDMADELLRLYAERKLVTGFAFSADAPWQREFEDAFPYELTEDQSVAVADVKADMETARPMDRLIIGDVGYGKTEVAMRAAFKAAMDGRQIALLTPTTILAYQHYETFKKRFAAFPLKIELLSRFRSPKEQKEVVAKAEKGEVDVLIGTHRILSSDVALPKLGLVVVDEEQRFGVAHKEKLKQLKKKVDVLTLSATPIPRTLNMSLLGMRDMSVIETPPRDRLAINTQVVQFTESVIKSAIELELARSGQIFFIHNRVETIFTIAAHLQKIVPNARIAVAHGQMGEKELEQVMLDFIDFKYDVLVATTIIENGIDIPRANTIIINRADAYGLSQLYQLRGRVGRSNRRAYAYLLIPSELELTPIARRRLSAIREFSDLGAGFRIAALDLELRGAGNILGGQQSGHLDALGFDLYVKMLERTIAELRGELIEDDVSVAINLGADVAIPHEYISETGQRLRTYKRVSSAANDEELNKIYDEISDRYGRMPVQVENLFAYARLRKIADEMRAKTIDKTREGFAIKFDENANVSPDALMDFVSKNVGAKFSENGILRVVCENDDLVEEVRKTLMLIRAE